MRSHRLSEECRSRPVSAEYSHLRSIGDSPHAKNRPWCGARNAGTAHSFQRGEELLEPQPTGSLCRAVRGAAYSASRFLLYDVSRCRRNWCPGWGEGGTQRASQYLSPKGTTQQQIDGNGRTQWPAWIAHVSGCPVAALKRARLFLSSGVGAQYLFDLTSAAVLFSTPRSRCRRGRLASLPRPRHNAGHCGTSTCRPPPDERPGFVLLTD